MQTQTTQRVETGRAPERVLFAHLLSEGKLDEARQLATEMLSRGTGGDEELAWCNNLATVASEQGCHREALAIHLASARLAEESSDHVLKANFHNELSITYKALGEADRAIVENTAAVVHYELAGHDTYLAGALNNFGCLLIQTGRPDEAHEHLERARRIYESHGEWARAAQIDNTRAEAYEAEGKLRAAEKCSAAAILALADTDELLALRESRKTYKRILQQIEREEDRERVRRALLESKGSVPLAGKIMGMTRQGVEHKLKCYPELNNLTERRGKNV